MIVLNVEAITIKLQGENIGGKLHDIGIGNDFLEMTPKAQAIKRKKITLKTFVHQWTISAE